MNLQLTAQLRELIRTARLRSGYSQPQLAANVKVSPATIRRIERGSVKEIKEDLIADIAARVGIPANEWTALASAKRPRRGSKDHSTARPRVPGPRILRKREPKSYSVFLAAPIAAAGSDYATLRRGVVLLSQLMERIVGKGKVFSAHADRATPHDYEDEAHALADNLSRLSRSRRLVAIVPAKRVSSVLVEIGAALACGNECLVLVRDRAHLPWILRAGGSRPLLRVVRYNKFDDIYEIVESERAWLRPASGNRGPGPALLDRMKVADE